MDDKQMFKMLRGRKLFLISIISASAYYSTLIVDATKNQNVCKGLETSDVKYFDIRFSKTTVPRNKTTYICQQFQVPSDDMYHAIAFEPLITNTEVMHHMLLFGCRNDVKPSTPHTCSQSDSSKCPAWLTVWTLGVQGLICMYNNTGVRFGKNSLSEFSLQIHWSNENENDGLQDNSGFRVYYTKKLRQFDVGNVQIGQNDIEIPPHSSRHLVAGSCSENCTINLPHSIYLTRTYLHLHHLGIQALFEVHRDGLLIHTIAEDTNYQYTESPIHTHSPAVEIRPGDEIRLKCWFKNNGTKPIYWGLGSDAEMCYAFVSYFPHVYGFNQCVQFDVYDTCPDPNKSDPTQIGPCHVSNFYKEAKKTLLSNIVGECLSGETVLSCKDVCHKTISMLESHECMQGRFGADFRRVSLPTLPLWDSVKEIIKNVHTLKLFC